MGRKGKRRETAPREVVVDRKFRFLGPLAIVAAGLAVYANSFTGPFLFDDLEGIAENTSIRRPWMLSEVFSPPRNSSVAGRPVANLTLALNYAVGGVEPRGYHVVNLFIHLCAGLVLFGIVRRTLESRRLREEYSSAAAGLATAAALLWVVHPLQTESVTYVIQRVESLMGLFYLLTLYAVIRYVARPGIGWYAVAVVSCALGMATKEVMATAPVVVLLCDRTFVAGTFRDALRQRWRLYAGLAVTWLILAGLVAGAPRGLSAGIGVKGVSPLTYGTTQLGVVVHYLRLSLWPQPLCLDYAWPLITPARDAVGPGLIIGALLAGTAWAMVWRPAMGFLGAWFFLILAPTSSFVTIKDAAFEHRMYLPLASVVVFVAVVAESILRGTSPRRRRAIAVGLVVLAGTGLGWATIARNRDYQSDLRMWTDVVHQRPRNPRGYFALGRTCTSLGLLDEAIGHYHNALKLDPDDARTYNNLAVAYSRQGRKEDAIREYEKALSIDPAHAGVHSNLGVLLADQGRYEEAIVHYQAAIQANPWAGTYNNLGNALAKVGRLEEATETYRAALRLEPESANTRNNVAALLAQQGRDEEAVKEYAEAVRLAPGSTVIRTNYGDCLMRLGRKAEAAEQYRRVLQMQPNDAAVRGKLEVAERGGLRPGA